MGNLFGYLVQLAMIIGVGIGIYYMLASLPIFKEKKSPKKTLSPAKKILQFAVEKNGKFTLPEICAYTDLDVEVCETTVQHLYEKGFFTISLTDKGAKVYVLSDAATDVEKLAAKDLLS